MPPQPKLDSFDLESAGSNTERLFSLSEIIGQRPKLREVGILLLPYQCRQYYPIIPPKTNAFLTPRECSRPKAESDSNCG